jgi:hypothetical protein
MAKTYSKLKKDRRLEDKLNMVKTYLIEAHVPESANHDTILKTLQKSSKQLPSNISISVSETREQHFFSATCRNQNKKHFCEIYIDTSNPRFLRLTTADKGDIVEWFIMKWASSSPLLDNVWLPWQSLMDIAQNPNIQFMAMSLDYDQRIWNEEIIDKYPVEYFKMQLASKAAKKVLDILKVQEDLKGAIDLSKVNVKYRLGENGDFSNDRIKYYGKITTSGNSFNAHLVLTNEMVLKPYIEKVRYYEKTYALRLNEKDNVRFTIEGSPIEISLFRKIESMKKFIEKIFSGSKPFRLIGVPIKFNDNFFKIRATDLHMETRVDFEIMPKLIRIFLFPGSCGNSVLRFHTNLQRHWDSTAKIEE